MGEFRLTDRSLERFRIWDAVTEAQLANSETIFTASGTTADLNTEISDLSTAGGGIVRIDGMHTLTANIAMKSNVLLIGYGPGTGIQNTGSSDYEIQFIGTTPTWYEISAPAKTGFTCDTAAEAANFSKSDHIIIRDLSTNQGNYEYVVASADGVAGTGVVTTFQSAFIVSAAAQAAVLTGLAGSGLMLMDIKNTSTGSLKVDIQYARNVRIESCTFEESFIDVDTSVEVFIDKCTFNLVDDVTPQTYWIQLVTGIVRMEISSCQFNGATYGIYSTTTMFGTNAVTIRDNTIRSRNGIWLDSTTTINKPTHRGMTIDNNTILGAQDGAGNSAQKNIYIDANTSFLRITDNVADNEGTTGLELDKAAGGAHSNATVKGNVFGDASNLYNLSTSTIMNNYFAANTQFAKGCAFTAITGNTIAGLTYLTDNDAVAINNVAFTGNYCGNLYCTGDASRIFADNVISGNKMGYLTITTHMNDCVIDGNVISSNVTFTDGGSNTMDRNVFSNNTVDGSVSWNNTDQDYWIVAGNSTNGTLTDLTGGAGTGNVHANNTEY